MTLVRHWRLQTQSGGVTPSALGDGIDGTLGPTYPTSAPVISGGPCSAIPFAMEFDGADDLVTLPQPTHSVGNVFSISAFMRTRDLNRRSIYSAMVGLNLPCFGLSVNYGAGKLEAIVSGKYVVVSDAAVISANTWYHVAWTRSSSSQNQFYLNGAPISTSTLDTGVTMIVGSYAYIGARGAGSQLWNGWLADVRVHDAPLTAAEVYAEYQEILRDNASLLGQP